MPATASSTTTIACSTGFLVGPYASIGLADGVTLNAGLFYGRSWNDAGADVMGTHYDGEFETDRLVLRAKLEGSWSADALTIRPSATFFLMNERADDYSVSTAGGSPIAVSGFENTDYRVGVGATFEYSFVLENGIELTPQLGLNLAGGSGGEDGGDLLRQGYGSLSAGIMLANDAWQLRAAIELDGDTSGARAISAKGTLTMAY